MQLLQKLYGKKGYNMSYFELRDPVAKECDMKALRYSRLHARKQVIAEQTRNNVSTICLITLFGLLILGMVLWT